MGAEWLSSVAQQATKHINDGRYMAAYRLLTASAQQHGTTYDGMVKDCQEQGLGNFTRLQDIVTRFQECIDAMATESGWTVQSDGKLRALYGRMRSDQGAHSFKFQSVINTKIENVVAIVRECDLLNAFDKNLNGEVLWRPDLFETAVRITAKGSVALGGYEYCLHAHGMNLAKEERCIMVLLNSLDTDHLPEGCTPPPAPSRKFTRMKLLRGSCMMLQPLQEKAPDGKVQVRMTLLVHMVPSWKLTPAWFAKLILRIGAPLLHKVISSALAKMFDEGKGGLPARMQQCPDLYDLIKEYYDDLYGNAAAPVLNGDPVSSSQ